MISGLTKKTFLILGLGIALLFGIKSQIADSNIGLALIAGYVLFSLNYIFLSRIYASLVMVSRTGETSPRLKAGLLLGTAVKFVGLIAALYTLIVLWKLPGLYIALGSLLSLFLLTSLLLSSYLKSFGPPSRS